MKKSITIATLLLTTALTANAGFFGNDNDGSTNWGPFDSETSVSTLTQRTKLTTKYLVKLKVMQRAMQTQRTMLIRVSS